MGAAVAIALAAFAGLRQGEVRALELRDVDLKLGVVAVRRALSENDSVAPKSGHERAVPLWPRLAEVRERATAREAAGGAHGSEPERPYALTAGGLRRSGRSFTLFSFFTSYPSGATSSQGSGWETKKTPAAKSATGVSFFLLGRGGQIRTADLTDPNRARYQTALRPEWALRWASHF